MALPSRVCKERVKLVSFLECHDTRCVASRRVSCSSFPPVLSVWMEICLLDLPGRRGLESARGQLRAQCLEAVFFSCVWHRRATLCGGALPWLLASDIVSVLVHERAYVRSAENVQSRVSGRWLVKRPKCCGLGRRCSLKNVQRDSCRVGFQHV